MSTIEARFTRNDVRKAFKAYKRDDEFTNTSCVVAQVAQRTLNRKVGCTYGKLYDPTTMAPNGYNHLNLGRFSGTNYNCPARTFDKLKVQVKNADLLYKQLKAECGQTINFELTEQKTYSILK